MINKNIRKINTLRFLCKILVNVVLLIRPEKAIIYNEIVNEWFVRFTKTINNCGLKHAIKVAKEERLIFLRYLSGEQMAKSNIIRVGLRKGLPKIKVLGKFDFTDPWDIRVAITILAISRCFTLPPQPDFKAITNCYQGSDNVKFGHPSDKEIVRAIRSLVREPTLRKLDLVPVKFHLSNKSSPMGSHAMFCSILEAQIISKLPLLGHLENIGGSFIKESIERISKSKVNEYLSKVKDFKIKTKSIRRMSVLSDKEGKSRVICILDYWSQMALKPLHDHFMKILSYIPSDLTYSQGEIPLEKINSKVFSFDLTNATDRFPISLQRKVLTSFIGESKSDSWVAILTSLPFDYKNKSYTYSVGQPLGAYSSWAVFTFCHHLVVRVAMQRAHYEVTTRLCYKILGDDIVIFDEGVAMEYQKIMEGLGVEISMTKSFQSNIFFELAKRNFIKLNNIWVEVTGFPFAGLIQSLKIPYLASQYFKGIINKGWNEIENLLNTPDVYKSFMKASGFFPNKKDLGDFILSQYSVTNLKQAERFCERFPGLNPYCNNKERFINYVYDCFVIAKMKVVSKDLAKLESLEVSEFLREIKKDTDTFDEIILTEGQDTSSLIRKPLSAFLPYITVWDTMASRYRGVRQDFHKAVDDYNDLTPYIFSDMELNFHLLPKMEVLRSIPRKQEEIRQSLKITRDSIYRVLPSLVESAISVHTEVVASIKLRWELNRAKVKLLARRPVRTKTSESATT